MDSAFLTPTSFRLDAFRLRVLACLACACRGFNEVHVLAQSSPGLVKWEEKRNIENHSHMLIPELCVHMFLERAKHTKPPRGEALGLGAKIETRWPAFSLSSHKSISQQWGHRTGSPLPVRANPHHWIKRESMASQEMLHMCMFCGTNLLKQARGFVFSVLFSPVQLVRRRNRAGWC